jgi:2-iminobutanoate/2-iminopropanoate deaminase
MSSPHLTRLEPTSFAPPMAPYSQGIAAGGMVFTAGQVALDGNNEVVAPGDTRQQTVVTLQRLEAVLKEAGASLDDVVSCSVFLTDLADFEAFNQGWTEMFGDHRPARATLKSELILEGLTVEIVAIAVKPDGA